MTAKQLKTIVFKVIRGDQSSNEDLYFTIKRVQLND